MADPILELGDSLNWDLVSRQSRTAQIKPDNQSGHIPIPDFNFVLSSYVLMVGVKSSYVKPRWWFGCRASMNLLISPSSTSEFTSVVEVFKQNCGLGRLTLLQLPKLRPIPYLLILAIPKWHRQIDIEVWQYSGLVTDDVSETLARIEGKVDVLT